MAIEKLKRFVPGVLVHLNHPPNFPPCLEEAKTPKHRWQILSEPEAMINVLQFVLRSYDCRVDSYNRRADMLARNMFDLVCA